MDKFSRAELVEKSAQIFERMPLENSLIACEDGQLFLDNAVSRGQLANHCKELDLEAYTILRSEANLKVVEKVEAKPAPIKFSKMNKTQLLEYAEANNIDVTAGVTNAEIAEILEASTASTSLSDQSTEQ